ncbi:hypothetical protein BBJ28_00021241, partial [Nothophytophthora sp. Chile5]
LVVLTSFVPCRTTELLRQDGQGQDPIILSASFEVSSFGYFQRSGERVLRRSDLQLSLFLRYVVEYNCHVYVRRDGLSGIVVCDQEYPPRVAFALLNKLMDEYDKASGGSWKTQSGTPQEFAPLTTALAEYQDPSKADKISAIQKELDETTAVLSKTIDNVLERGEKLDDLVSKSQDLSSQSKVFYKQAKKTNSCCVVM